MNKEPGYVYILTRSTSGRLHTCKNPCFREDWVKIGKSSHPAPLSMCGIKIGEQVTFDPAGIVVKVTSDDGIEYEGRIYKLSPFVGTFVNNETLNEFVVTIERKNVEDNVEVGDRDIDREDRDKVLNNKELENIENSKIDREDRDADRDNNVEHLHISYKTLECIQKNIVQFCSVPRSAREILDHIGYAYNSTNIANQIKPLLELGFIEMTEPDKPNSKNQKYRKTHKMSDAL